MVPISELWLPILLSAVVVFVVSSIIHMVLGYHRNDFKKVPSEDAVMDALRPFAIPPGDYVVPCVGSMKEMGTPEYKTKVEKGPVGFMTICPTGMPTMGGALVLWFLYSILVSIFAGYVAAHAVPAGGAYLAVFRYVGTVAFCSYSLGLLQNSIWYKRNWGATLLSVFDGLIYALVTAGTFGWLWPS